MIVPDLTFVKAPSVASISAVPPPEGVKIALLLSPAGTKSPSIKLPVLLTNAQLSAAMFSIKLLLTSLVIA